MVLVVQVAQVILVVQVAQVTLVDGPGDFGGPPGGFGGDPFSGPGDFGSPFGGPGGIVPGQFMGAQPGFEHLHQ